MVALMQKFESEIANWGCQKEGIEHIDCKQGIYTENITLNTDKSLPLVPESKQKQLMGTGIRWGNGLHTEEQTLMDQLLSET